jgi:hypothetical protein
MLLVSISPGKAGDAEDRRTATGGTQQGPSKIIWMAARTNQAICRTDLDGKDAKYV